MSKEQGESGETDRRSVLQAGAGLFAAVGVTGCLGEGGSSNNSSSNGSGNGSGAESSPTVSTSETTDSGETTRAGSMSETTTTAIPSVLGSEVEFDDGEMSIPLNTDATLNTIQLNSTNGDVFATYEPHQYEGAATFMLIEQTSEQFGYKRYPFGTYMAKAIREDSVVDSRSYDLQPEFSVTNIESQQELVAIEIENIGTAPAPITAARLYRAGMNPGSQEFGGGFVDENAIVPPEESITIKTRLMGFADVYSVGNNSSASDYEDKYCTGESQPITVSYRVFAEVREITGSLVFGGGPTEGPNGTVVCQEYTINVGANVTTNGTNGTGNLSQGNESNVSNGSNQSNATAGNLTVGNDSSATTTTNTSTWTNQSNSSDN